MSLSDTQRLILTAAAQHAEQLAFPPERLPAGARQKVAQALLKQNMVISMQGPGSDATVLWTVAGTAMLLKITDEGLRAIGIDPNHGDAGATGALLGASDSSAQQHGACDAQAAQEASQVPVAGSRASLRNAAAALLAAWDDEPSRKGDFIGALDAPMEALRTLLAGKPARVAREPGAPRKPREGTKQEQVLAMLRRSEGATVAQIADATGWAQHTVRGFFAGLKKKGHAVEVLERVRQVGPNKEGALGSFSIYRITA
jgi:hypothetical protein